MKSFSPSTRSRTRTVLATLSCLGLLASLQPLLLPRQPQLPQLPDGTSLPAGWQVVARSGNGPATTPDLPPAPRVRGYRPLFSAMAVGDSTTLKGPDGAVVRLTPLASWSGNSISVTSFGLSCLTSYGTLESLSENITRMPTKAERQPLPWFQRLLFFVLPNRDRNFGCLLVSTNTPALLANNQGLWAALSRASQWPIPPSF